MNNDRAIGSAVRCEHVALEPPEDVSPLEVLSKGHVVKLVEYRVEPAKMMRRNQYSNRAHLFIMECSAEGYEALVDYACEHGMDVTRNRGYLGKTLARDEVTVRTYCNTIAERFLGHLGHSNFD